MINKKLETYEPESQNMPFFEAIFSKEQIITASIIQSFYTSFGMSGYEQIAKLIAEDAGCISETQHNLDGTIDKKTESVITQIHLRLRDGDRWDDKKQKSSIKRTIKESKGRKKDPDRMVDLYVKKPDGSEYLFGITTVKPNKEGFSTHARKMLRWIALAYSKRKNSDVHVGVVIPYNPYEPLEYNRWNSRNMFSDSLYVGKGFWDFVGCKTGTYEELLSVFEEVGNETKDKIQQLLESSINKKR